MTIVRDFLQWLASAPANERAEAVGTLARAYLCSDLTVDELSPAEGLMLRLLDDPSPLVRRALADALAASPAAPAPVIIALASDQRSTFIQCPNCSLMMRSSRLWPGSNSICMVVA